MAHFSDLERQSLSAALTENFRQEELRRLLQSDLGQEFDHLVSAPAYAAQVAEIVNRAEERGWSLELLDAAVSRRPDVEAFLTLHYRKGRLKVGGLENIVRAGNFVNFAAFIDWAMRVRRAVCSIKLVGPKTEIGTAFLVGPDLLLTNYHVVAQAIENPAGVERVVLLFDFVGRDAGLPISYAVSDLSVLAHRPPASEADEERAITAAWDPTCLDYALIRLPDTLGQRPYNSQYGKLPLRGWLTLAKPTQSLKKDRILRITQHPYGEEMQLAEGKALGLDPAGLRVRYQANTDRGSSGAPVFNEETEIVALHHRGNWAGTENQGIPILAILEDLEAQGIDLPPAAPAVAFTVAGGEKDGVATEAMGITEVLFNQPFIGRNGLKQYCADLLAGQRRNPVLLLNGRSRAGRTYLGYYFDRLAAVGYFHLIKIDFRGRTDLHPAELARQLAIALDLAGFHAQDPVGRYEDFKQQIFLTQVEQHLVRSKKQYLFFLDHCHEARLSQSVRDLIVGLANLIGEERVPGIFAGIGIDREDQLRINGVTPTINNFVKEDVAAYFKSLYATLQPQSPEADFVDFAMGKIPARLFETETEVNVEEIGRRARIIADALREAHATTHAGAAAVSSPQNLDW
ncbi:trypsin-like peptidase domain-containing protein [Neolewinella lacunae]|uniref:Serine protease n=1 Tax=Neolewinella lacunae TaxID=1517758 RepID=A0A923PM18_9BACT|nr:trypsin-like peptidase domain-containing protein [Neolewinella lacunae]MBC6996557.1 trypsin-like peptidase domain-containing protein [Neolewinella lacunae]MDN3634879.1 trypsin-like peptidase domain-containing protein [Neolewinella lacunae]